MLDRTPTSPRERVLSDGTPLSALIDRSRREVAQRVMNDQEIYEIEQERIFAKAWIVVGHESEIPEKGDFITREIGEDPVIVVRRSETEIECLLNACAHRGATVCRAEIGNASLFRCIYHGWIYNLDGSLRGVPFQDEMCPDGLDKTDLGLRKARVEIFGGIIFANWDADAPSLDTFLGGFRWYLNAIFNRSNRGVEVIGPPHRFIVNANWKTASEQFAGDGQHAPALHRSISDFAGIPLNEPIYWQLYDPKVSTKEGHGVICFSQNYRTARFDDAGNEAELSLQDKLTLFPPAGMTKDMIPELMERFNDAELEMLANTPPTAGGMFPNVGMFSVTSSLPDKTPGSFLSLRTFVPRGPDKFEFVQWVFVDKGASEEFRERVRYVQSLSNGATGYVEADDAEVWPGLTRSARGFIGKQNRLKYHYMSEDSRPKGWPGGGNVHLGYSKDNNQWAWWSRYFDYLTGEA